MGTEMQRRTKAATTALIVVWLIASATMAGAREMPKESRDKLESVFARVADDLWLKTDEAWHDGRLDVIAGLCRFIVEIDPSFLEAYNIGAWLLDSDDRFGEAEALHRKAIAANPDRYEPFFEIGMFYDQKKDYVNAEKYFREATARSAPTFVWRMMAHMREKTGDHHGALDAWETVKKMDPADAMADSGIAREKAAIEESKGK
jgi:tetratricopeptide (TPR) repeat protein